MNKLLTVLMVQCQTPELTKICLRLLNLHTDLSLIEIIVVDNHSGDESVDYLRKLPFIRLIERPATGAESAAESFGRALDLGLAEVTTPLVMIIHSDTLVMSDAWFEAFTAPFEKDRKLAGLGGWKLKPVTPLKRLGKSVEDAFRAYVMAPLRGRKWGERPVRHKDHYYLRSHCAVFRTELLRQCTTGFAGGGAVGQSVSRELAAAGYKLRFLPPKEMSRYICHLSYGTGIQHAEAASGESPVAMRRLRRQMARLHCREILADDRLDIPGSMR
ncbi:MAG: glycosyltransferase family 2 protein [Victivallaceae bacterium]